MRKEKIAKAWSLCCYFFHISWFTFGGGWSIVAQMQKDFVDDRKELSAQELLDIVSVGRSLPGTMIGNVAYLYGYHCCGFLGGLLSLAGMILPPMIILSVVTFGYSAFKENPWVAKMLAGVRASVVPIISIAALKLRNGAFAYKICYAVCAAGCVLSVVFNVNCVLIILFGMAAGLLIGKRKEAEK